MCNPWYGQFKKQMIHNTHFRPHLFIEKHVCHDFIKYDENINIYKRNISKMNNFDLFKYKFFIKYDEYL